MNSPIKTNQINFEIDYEKLDELYDIFMVSTTDKYFKDGAKILDVPLLENNVCAIRYSCGKTFWLLMRKKDNNLSLLKDLFEKTEDGEKVTIEQKSSHDVYSDTLLQLLLNSLGTAENKYLRYNNLTGHLYCFHPNWIQKHKKGDEIIIWQVPCLEISVSQQCRLLINVRTFSNVILRNKMTFGKKAFNQYPQYIMTGKNTLRRKLDDDNEKSFIMRQINNKRNEIPFLDIKDIEKFSESKVGILAEVLNSFNYKYNGIAKIELKNICEYIALEYTTNTANENDYVIAEALSKLPIKIIDCINDEYSKMFCEDVIGVFEKKYNKKVSFGKRVSSQYYNIRVIHNKTYYKGANDPHDDTFENCSVQHITLEDFHCSEAVVKAVVHELLIKQDLIRKEISLFDWKGQAYQNSWTFAIPSEIGDIRKYLFMTVQPDGKFEIFERKLDLFNIDDYANMVKIFEAKVRSDEKVLGIVKNDKGEINIIRETGWYTVPEFEKLKKELNDGNTYLRNKAARAQFLSACLDIKCFTEQDEHYYFVGTIGHGMRALINCSCNIRKVEPHDDAPIFFEKLLPLMNVSFVRNGQLTILPFPFKYLREYSMKYLNQ